MDSILTPYLMFNGECKEAMEFYKSILGGELTMQSYGDSGMGEGAGKDRIIHASLKNGSLSFMASDGAPEDVNKVGDNVHLSIVGDDEPKLTEFFNKLAEGGKIDTPLAKQFWGDTYGMLTDKYGLHWMVNIGTHVEAQ